MESQKSRYEIILVSTANQQKEVEIKYGNLTIEPDVKMSEKEVRVAILKGNPEILALLVDGYQITDFIIS